MINLRSFSCLLLLACAVLVQHGDCAPTTTSSASNTTAPIQSRIVGGSEAPDHSLTHVASVQSTQTGHHLCGSAILNQRYLLTAARCVAYQSANVLRVRVGSKSKYYGGVLHQVASVRAHPQYDSYNLLNDVGLVRTAQPIIYTQYVSAVALGAVNYEVVNGVVAGWGKTSASGSGSETLRQLSTRTITNTDCKRRYANKPQLAANIRQGTLCTLSSGRGVCDGDNGGPLTVNGELVGLVSWATRDCASGYPDVYTRVATYRTWIQQNSREYY